MYAASNSQISARSQATAARSVPTVMLAGDWRLPEFAFARQSLALLDAPIAATLDEAIARAAASVAPPDLVFAAAPRPGMVTQEHVTRLGAVAPLARLVIVAGAWCEGEWRTGRAPLGAIRLYWHEVGPWWREGLGAIAVGATPPWSAPLDEPRAGRTSLHQATDGRRESRGWIAVDTIAYATFDSLAAALHEFGWRCSWTPRTRRGLGSQDPTAFSAGIWDGGQLDERELESLREFCDWLQPQQTPVAALLDYPRTEHLHAADRAGAATIMGKPYSTERLHDELRPLVGTIVSATGG